MYKFKKTLVLITIIYFINLLFSAQSEILIIPKKKPIITSEKKILSELKTEILPIKKPIKQEKKIIAVESDKKKNNLGILIPKSKPLIIAKKKIEKKGKFLKSKFYSKKDTEIAKKSISLMEKRKWETAIKTSKRAKNKSIYISNSDSKSEKALPGTVLFLNITFLWLYPPSGNVGEYS